MSQDVFLKLYDGEKLICSECGIIVNGDRDGTKHMVLQIHGTNNVLEDCICENCFDRKKMVKIKTEILILEKTSVSTPKEFDEREKKIKELSDVFKNIMYRMESRK